MRTIAGMDDSEMLAIQFRTLFVLTASGRIERENDPDRSPGPLFWLAGGAEGSVSGFRFDVDDEAVRGIEALVAAEPPLVGGHRAPVHLERYVHLLTAGGRVPKASLGLTYALPHDCGIETGVEVITSESDEGRRLQASFDADGVPDQLVAVGFRDVSDFWPPWCVAIHEGRPVSVAFAARLSGVGAELGLVTVPEFRGRGFGAAATAGWTTIPSLRRRVLFYSTDQTNRSSQRVAARLGLRLVGSSLRVS